MTGSEENWEEFLSARECVTVVLKGLGLLGSENLAADVATMCAVSEVPLEPAVGGELGFVESSLACARKIGLPDWVLKKPRDAASLKRARG